MPDLIFDFDSTLVSVEGLDELFAHSVAQGDDREERVAAFREITDLGMAGEIDARESLNRRLAVLDADRQLVGRVGAEISESLTPSVVRNLEFFRANAGRIHVVSGGFDELIVPTLKRVGLSPTRLWAHRFRYDENGRVVGLDPQTPLALEGKAGAVRRMDGSPAERWMVGDGSTDLELRQLGLVDRFIAFTEVRHRDPVVSKADHVVRSIDELIDILEER